MSVIRGWLCIALICLAAAGCGLGRPSVELSFGDPLNERLSDLLHSGKSARLSEPSR